MRNYDIGNIWGIPIRVNVSLLIFLPILAYLIGSGEQIELYAGFIADLTGDELSVEALVEARWTVGVLAALGLFAGVLLHELGHSYVAMRYGIGISSITLWIFGGVAALESMPKEWNREFWIAIAGPVVSVAVGVFCLVALQFVPASVPVLVFVVGWLGMVNILLAVFNMVPAFPMDGGRILRALLARNRPHASATKIAASVGVGFSFVFMIFGALSFNIILVLIGVFVYGAAKGEARVTAIAEALEGFYVKDVVRRDPVTLSPDTTIDELTERVFESRMTAFPVVEDDDYVGFVTIDDVRGVEDRSGTKVGDVMRKSDVVVSSDTSAFDGFVELSTARVDYATVERDGDAVGVVTISDFLEVMRIATVGGRSAPDAEAEKLERGVV